MRIAVMGAGGVGGYFGGRLAHAGQDVTFIARGEHLHALQERGLEVRSVHGDFTLPMVKATDDPATVGPVDLVLVCVKAYDTDAAARAIRPMVGPETADVVTSQQGDQRSVFATGHLHPRDVTCRLP
jgi:2-dehydropantoate 2-reductase